MCSPHYHGQKKDWQVVSAKKPCPVCQKTKRCKISPDGKALNCFGNNATYVFDGLAWQFRKKFGDKSAAKPTSWYKPLPVQQIAPESFQPPDRLDDVLREWKAALKKPRRLLLLTTVAEEKSIPVVGMDRMQATVMGDTLFWPQKWRLEDNGEWKQFGGFSTLHVLNFEKKQAYGLNNGVHLWRDKDCTYLNCVEGATDASVLAACNLSVASRPNNVLGGKEFARLIKSHETAVVWGENDQKGDKWPGKKGADTVSKIVADETLRDVVVVYPPAEFKDLRDWWISLCESQQFDPVEPHARARYVFAELVKSRIADHGETVQPSRERQREIMANYVRASAIAAIGLISECTCGAVRHGYHEFSDGRSVYGGIRPRCRNVNKCQMCARVEEKLFQKRLVKVWIDKEVGTVYRYEVHEDEAEAWLRKIRDLGGEYAWIKLPDDLRVILSDVKITGYVGEAKAYTNDCLMWLEDAYYAEAEPGKSRMYFSKEWNIPNSPDMLAELGFVEDGDGFNSDAESSSTWVDYGCTSMAAIAAVAEARKVTIDVEEMHGAHETITMRFTSDLEGVEAIDDFIEAVNYYHNQDYLLDFNVRLKRSRSYNTQPKEDLYERDQEQQLDIIWPPDDPLGTAC